MDDRGSAAVVVILVTFVCASITLVMFQVRRDLELTTAFDEEKVSENAAWVGLERFFRDNPVCTQFLKRKKLGESLLGGRGDDMPKVGREWDESGWLVKEMYVLRREDEIAWQVKRNPSSRPGLSTVYLKIGLVPLPAPGIKAGVDYMLRAPTSTRLIAVRVTMAHERVFGHCQRQVAEQACYQAGEARGIMPRMSGGRMPASQEFQCREGEPYRVQCLIPEDSAPIWRCNN
jgi:hypothetical protein